jgi:hypothetical protein
MLLLVLLALQITLGALTVLSQKQFLVNSLHVVNGALVLVTSLVLTLRAHRARFADAGSAVSFAQRDGNAGSAVVFAERDPDAGSAVAFAERDPAHVQSRRGLGA